MPKKHIGVTATLDTGGAEATVANALIREQTLDPTIPLRRIDLNRYDPEFADLCVEKLLDLLAQGLRRTPAPFSVTHEETSAGQEAAS